MRAFAQVTAKPEVSRLASARRKLTEEIDDHRRPVWLEATNSFYKKLNRIAKECGLSRYEALSRGLDALLRETQIRNSALNRNIKSPGQSEVFRRTMGQVSRNYWASVLTKDVKEARRAHRFAGADAPQS